MLQFKFFICFRFSNFEEALNFRKVVCHMDREIEYRGRYFNTTKMADAKSCTSNRS